MTTAVRTRAEIERDIASKRRERELYVSAEGVRRIHGEIDRLLEEWLAASPQQADDAEPQATTPAPRRSGRTPGRLAHPPKP